MQPGSPWNVHPPPPPSRGPWVLLVVVVAVVALFMVGAMVAGALFWLRLKAAAPPPPVATWTAPPVATPVVPTATIAPPMPVPVARKLWVVPVGGSPVRGRSDALVTLVEFSEFQCPFCKRAAPTVDKLRAEYGADLRVVWKNEPLAFHPNALPAAELALEARAEGGDAKFWAVHDDLMKASALDEPSLLTIARARGVRETRVQAAIASKLHQSIIDDDEDLARSVAATGTPTFFVNGRLLVGAQPIDKFEAMIDDALRDAKARVAAGTPRARVYDAIQREAAARP